MIVVKRLLLLFFIILPNIINASDFGRGYSSHFFDNFDMRWSLGIMGFEHNLKNNSGMMVLDFPKLRLLHSQTRIGLEFTPVRIWGWLYGHDESVDRIDFSFLNFNIFWNTVDIIFDSNRTHFFAGPFNRINYINLYGNSRLNWNSFVYSAGFRIGLNFGRFDGQSINSFWDGVLMSIVGSEIGFRNMNGANTFFVNVHTDIILVIFYLIGSAVNTD